jgi:hypothetical protein
LQFKFELQTTWHSIPINNQDRYEIMDVDVFVVCGYPYTDPKHQLEQIIASKLVIRDRIRQGRLLKGATNDIYKEFVFDKTRVDLDIQLTVPMNVPSIEDQRVSRQKAFDELMSL